MSRWAWAVLLSAYVLGVLAGNMGAVLGVGALGLLTAGGLLAWQMPQRWRAGPHGRVWLAAGLVGAIALLYTHLLQPQPGPQDISHTLPRMAGEEVILAGQILEPPRLTRKQRTRLILGVEQLNNNAQIRGKVYATLPLLHGTGLVPGQRVQLQGRLYDPPRASTPGGFDFREFLARQGIFAGFSGELAAEPTERPGGLWQARERIVRAFVDGLGSPKGVLVAGMVLGRKAVDLAIDVQTQFIQVGLAHTLAASGFHVTTLLGVVSAVTRFLPPRVQMAVGVTTLAVYVGLTGLQAAVVRAAVMGVVALSTLVWKRRVRSLGLILVTATVLLLFNPRWLADVGFQLSFMATVGLITATPWVMARLTFLPSYLATVIAVPIAAMVWTLPLLVYHFKTLSLYNVVVSIVTTPLITVISTGGFGVAIAALFSPSLGALIALALTWPVTLLFIIVEWFYHLPGSLRAVGAIHPLQIALVYGVGLALCWRPWPWRRHLLLILAGLGILFIPLWVQGTTRVAFTLLPTAPQPVVIVEDRGKVGLIGGGDGYASADRDVIDYQITPFLHQRGINRLDGVVLTGGSFDLAHLALNRQLQALWTTAPAQFEGIPPLSQSITIGATTLHPLNPENSVLWLHQPRQNWLLILAPVATLPAFTTIPDVAIIAESALTPDLLSAIPAPVVVITNRQEPEAFPEIHPQNFPHTQLHWLGDGGMVQWNAHQGLNLGEDLNPTLE
ncbi:ComEC/Rec2 family competence protein [Spirulina sp. CCNP1310]|uniref:ComEC/Rec2 family competence protein n=1 Tax=Spirulina sp. CCNP1310 TaxID=3110249 RepID=UPI002B20EED1|nr:ComEC/Rec2 family competence protein [Spirulina sp. CCNP1310]MEA5419746.1 ComEC/Rec2 family competence protein [Spirulina sp. CCNP1310]